MNFRIDTLPPATTATLSPDQPDGENGWYRAPVTVSLSATDATSGIAETRVRIDGGALQSYAGPITFAADGPHSVEFSSIDNAGNAEAAKRIELKVDRTPPSTSASLAGPLGDDGWFLGDVAVSLSATDATSGVKATFASVDGGAFGEVSGPLAIAGDGSHTVQFYSRDMAGNVEALRSIAVRIDTTPPVTTASLSGAPGDDSWFLSSVGMALTAHDATSGVRFISVRVDGQEPSPAPDGDIVVCLAIGCPVLAPPGTVRFVVEGDGLHTVEFFSRDVAGNVEPVQRIDLKIDTTPPRTSIAIGSPQYSHGASQYVSAETQFELSASDTTSGVRATFYRVNSGGRVSYEGPFTLGEADGPYTIEFFSRDIAGNMEPAQTLTVLLDNTAPMVDITRPLVGTFSVGEHYVLLDTDLDGYPEPVEALLGSDPRNPASTPALPVLPATEVPGATQEVGPVPVEVPGQTIVVPGVRQSFEVPVSQPGQHVTVPGVNQRVGPVEVVLPATTISIPAVGPYPPVVLELPERSFGTPGVGPVPAQTVSVPDQSVGPVGGPLPPIGTTETRGLVGKAYVIGGTLVPVRVASEDPVVNGVASGVGRVLFLVNGRLAFIDASPPYEFLWDTAALPLGDHMVEAVSIDNVENSASDGFRAYVMPGTEEGVRATARPHVQRLAAELRAAMASAGADFEDANDDLVPDELRQSKALALDAATTSLQAGDALALRDADGDGFPDEGAAALRAGADAALPALVVPAQSASTPGVSVPTVPAQTVSAPGLEVPGVPGQSVGTPDIELQVGNQVVSIPAQSLVSTPGVPGASVPPQTVATPELAAPTIPGQSVNTQGIALRVGEASIGVPAQTLATPEVSAPSVPPQTVATPEVSPSYPPGVPTSCSGTAVQSGAGAKLVPTRIELPNGASVVLPLPAASPAADARACGVGAQGLPGLLPSVPAPPDVPKLPLPG